MNQKNDVWLLSPLRQGQESQSETGYLPAQVTNNIYHIVQED